MSRSTSIFTRLADVAHRGAVLGLLSFFGFQAYQIAANVNSGRPLDSPYMKSTYRDDVRNKVEEEYRKDNIVDSRESRDWYDEDDESYKSKLLRPNMTKPDFQSAKDNK